MLFVTTAQEYISGTFRVYIVGKVTLLYPAWKRYRLAEAVIPGHYRNILSKIEKTSGVCVEGRGARPSICQTAAYETLNLYPCLIGCSFVIFARRFFFFYCVFWLQKLHVQTAIMVKKKPAKYLFRRLHWLRSALNGRSGGTRRGVQRSNIESGGQICDGRCWKCSGRVKAWQECRTRGTSGRLCRCRYRVDRRVVCH